MNTTTNEFLSTAFAEILKNSNDFLFIKDADCRYQFASDSFERLVGLQSGSDLAGKSDYDFFPKAIADKIRADDCAILKSAGTKNRITEILSGKNGVTHQVETSKRIMKDASGAPVGICGISKDTQHSALDEKQEQQYSDLISKIPGGIGILHETDGSFYLDFANDGWYRIHHAEKRDDYGASGINVMHAIYKSDIPQLLGEYERIRNSPEQTGRAVYRVKDSRNQLFWVSVEFQFAYSDNSINYYYASYADLTEQKQTEERLAESRKDLQDAVANSDIQFFTYFPAKKKAEIYALNNRLAELPTEWDNFPESFLVFTKASPEDADAYRTMIAKIDRGEDSSECTVRFAYHGVYTWERLHIKAVRDASGHTIKAQGYSVNVTNVKDAEERIRKERVRQKTLEGNIFEAFSFNISKNSQPEIQTSDKTMIEEPVDEKIVKEALQIAPPLANINSGTRDILLRAACHIPDENDRRRFISACSGSAMRRLISEGKYNAELTYRRRIGTIVRWVSTNSEVLPDPDTGDLIAFYFTKDITDDVQKNEIANRIIGKNYECVSCWDLQTDRFFVKAGSDLAMRALNGLHYQEAITAAAQRHVFTDDASEFLRALAPDVITAALKQNRIYTTYNRRNERAESITSKPLRRMKNDIFYLDDNHDAIVFLLTDVTEIFEQDQENREKMAQALAAAEQASVAKTEFLSRMSHEIRTPMNAIIGLDAIALQEKDISSAMEDHLQKIGLSARFLLSLINDILDMSRIESGRMMLKNEPFNFEELISGINTILYEQCRDSGLDYDCVLKSFTEDIYVGDVTKLQQVLVNILGNAVKFTPKGGKIHFMIEQLSRTADRAKMRFEISDTGIGIDEKFIPHLFEPFSQENRGRTSAYGGTGLGLAISKNIVHLMGGDISVHSIKNVGTEFTVDVDLGLTQETIKRHELFKMQPRSLFTLIVDDDVIVCRHTQMVLNEAGLKAEWIDSGAGAIEKVTSHHRDSSDYDLILLDWKMPDMDGIETAHQIRKIVGPDVTIIIMTAYDWADIEKKAKDAGVDMFMKKPVFASSVTKAFENVFFHKQDKLVPSPVHTFDFTGKRILLAEDNEINAEIARNLLEMKNCAVETASNGAEAVESFASAKTGYYDAILMDVRMPVMDGLDAARTIRAMRKEGSKSIPIIAMTANAFQEDINLSLENGMSAHLAKPIEPQLLYETLEKYFKAQD